MNVIYALENIPDTLTRSVMLCGPTPRSLEVPSWRPAAISWFDYFKFPGTLLVPENRAGQPFTEYDHQVAWEQSALEKADIIMFWIPRNLDTLPALTTNCEFGWWMNSGKVILGYPPEAVKMKYLDYHAKRLNIPIADNLEYTVELVCNKLLD